METAQNTQTIQKMLDPLGIAQSYIDIYYSWLSHPEKIYPEMMGFLDLATKINLQVFRRAFGEEVTGSIIPKSDDEQFKDPIWQENPFSDWLKEYYLLNHYWCTRQINSAEGVKELTKRRASFWSQQLFSALSPANFFLSNPRAIMRCIETGGKSVEEGLLLLANDIEQQNISMVDGAAFTVGENLGMTPGKVVYRNELFELIQYKPTTETVHSMPIVIIPPWINKFYILDLNKKKSMIQYLLDQKHTVFIVSWRNPPAAMRNTTFTDYLMKGILQATTVARSICKVEQVHCVGYCIGGTALSTLMAWLNSNQQEIKKSPIAHFTLFCSLLTFEQPGEIDVFIDENIVEMLEEKMAKVGYLDGKEIGQTFRMLKSTSLVWSYFTNSYLLGQAPTTFDVLFWNTDNTRLPEKMHSFYLRNFYLANNLAKKNALKINNQLMDLSRVKQPVYAVGTQQDHITPWKETFKSVQLIGGEKRYVLSTSGHIVGIVNPPTNPPKRDYWVNDVKAGDTAEESLGKQQIQAGSWWGDWTNWLKDKCGPEYPIICDAPGTYVVEK